jgi:hypothetical protein
MVHSILKLWEFDRSRCHSVAYVSDETGMQHNVQCGEGSPVRPKRGKFPHEATIKAAIFCSATSYFTPQLHFNSYKKTSQNLVRIRDGRITSRIISKSGTLYNHNVGISNQ